MIHLDGFIGAVVAVVAAAVVVADVVVAAAAVVGEVVVAAARCGLAIKSSHCGSQIRAPK